eukprot:COSAG01_NODE_2406_length_7755_cov_316.703892_4_plen_65_part_00
MVANYKAGRGAEWEDREAGAERTRILPRSTTGSSRSTHCVGTSYRTAVYRTTAVATVYWWPAQG